MILKPCPFCGGQPMFSMAEWKDDRRYVEVELTCRNVLMADDLPWSLAKDMDGREIESRLTTSLTAIWNNRYAPEPDEIVAITDPPSPIQENPKYGRF